MTDTQQAAPMNEEVSPINKEASPINKEEQIKTVTMFYAQLAGDWQGSYSLWLRPGAPEEKSKTHANFSPAANSSYLLMTYDWQRGGKAYEGVFLFGGRDQAATVTWGDSFHMAPELMHCQGGLQENGEKLILNGSYPAGEGPDWGWRTEFSQQGTDGLLMEAYNITPEGEEGLAVRAVLSREKAPGL